MGGGTLEETVRAVAFTLVAEEPLGDTLQQIALVACDLAETAIAAVLVLVDDRGRTTDTARAGSPAGQAGDTLSVALGAAGRSIGTLTLHAGSGAFTPADHAAANVFAAQAAVVIANASAYWELHEVASGLQAAMQSRAVIEQAKGKIMAVDSTTADEAFTRLARTSQRDNVKLRDLARAIVDGTYDRELAGP
jgi:GAF domain-containing protein